MSRLKKLLLYILLLGFTYSTYGQIFRRKKGENDLLILVPGFSSQGRGNFYTELNFMYAKFPNGYGEGYALIGPRIGVESNLVRTILSMLQK